MSFKHSGRGYKSQATTSEGKFQVNMGLKSTRTRQNLTSIKSVVSFFVQVPSNTINHHQKYHPTFIRVSPIFLCFALHFAFCDLLATSRMATAICQQPALPQALIKAPNVMLSGASSWSRICRHSRSAWRQEASQAPHSEIYHRYRGFLKWRYS